MNSECPPPLLPSGNPVVPSTFWPMSCLWFPIKISFWFFILLTWRESVIKLDWSFPSFYTYSNSTYNNQAHWVFGPFKASHYEIWLYSKPKFPAPPFLSRRNLIGRRRSITVISSVIIGGQIWLGANSRVCVENGTEKGTSNSFIIIIFIRFLSRFFISGKAFLSF